MTTLLMGGKLVGFPMLAYFATGSSENSEAFAAEVAVLLRRIE